MTEGDSSRFNQIIPNPDTEPVKIHYGTFNPAEERLTIGELLLKASEEEIIGFGKFMDLLMEMQYGPDFPPASHPRR